MTAHRLRARPESFPIVGVGASAGGLEAFRRLLGALPSEPGMALVLVQHLDPNHESILAELLSEVTEMNVTEVGAETRVEPNHVYVIPPSKELILSDGSLKLLPRTPPGTVHSPIDSFFGTLAEVQGAAAIGVVLSGTGSDGTRGLQAIEAAGGIAFAQEPTSAQSPDMPRSAIASGAVDFVLSPEDIAKELQRLGQHPYVLGSDAATSAQALSAPTPSAAPSENAEFLRILELLRKRTGTDFSSYKQTTLRRRIARRMAVTHSDSFEQYARFLEQSDTEASALHEDCLISVTSFFRDPKVYQSLAEQVLPALLKDRPSDAPLRVWVPGCATGEEAYSIAMCLLEGMAKLSSNHTLQIFATDLSERALAKAREGRYLLRPDRDISAERLRRFFNKIGELYQISKTIRELCVFARHDVTRDPPYSRLDLISCRNLLIYLEPRLQERLFATFHYALCPQGFLLVGTAESVGASGTLFPSFDSESHIYTRSAGSGTPRLLTMLGGASPLRIDSPRAPSKPALSDVMHEVDRILLARSGQACVIVDDALRVVEFRGDTAPFLEHGQGRASLSLERLIRKGLLMELRRAVADARRTDAPVLRAGLKVRHQQQLQNVRLEVVPIKGRAVTERCLLVLFEAIGDPIALEQSVGKAPGKPADAKSLAPDTRDLEIERLAQSLGQTTEYVHTLVREHESALEELQSTAEEALSSNEELQSLNEELQTAKEEIQSANEELATLNQELQARNAQLLRSNEVIQRGLDSANELVDAVPGPLVMLDEELRIERGNAAFQALLAAKAPSPHLRTLAELGGHEWDDPDLRVRLQAVVADATPLENWEVQLAIPELGQRSLLLNARRLPHNEQSPMRVLLSIEDRTDIKRAEEGREALLALEHDARTQAEAADRLKDEFVATASHELRGPLTVISGWTNALLEAGTTLDPITLSRALAAMSRAVRAQGRLISDMLDHSRMVSGNLELRREPIDLLVVAEAALVGVKAAAEAKDIRLELIPPSSPCTVLGDFDRMQQVLWNLFLNAVKFTRSRGSVRISIDRTEGQAEITVRDTGCGISSDFLPHVFERFRQAEGSSKRSQAGLGLGLALVRGLVEMHGGTVRAESPGKGLGATFTVVLPIPAILLEPPPELPSSAHEEPSIGPSSVPPPPPAPGLRHILEGIELLVVDDDADAREVMVNFLERHGAKVASAASVDEAMVALESAVPDVLISDLGMPEADGYELLRRVRESPAAVHDLPALAVSGYATEQHRNRALSGGFQQYLRKPVVPAELVTEVARLAGRTTEAVRLGGSS